METSEKKSDLAQGIQGLTLLGPTLADIAQRVDDLGARLNNFAAEVPTQADVRAMCQELEQRLDELEGVVSAEQSERERQEASTQDRMDHVQRCLGDSVARQNELLKLCSGSADKQEWSVHEIGKMQMELQQVMQDVGHRFGEIGCKLGDLEKRLGDAEFQTQLHKNYEVQNESIETLRQELQELAGSKISTVQQRIDRIEKRLGDFVVHEELQELPVLTDERGKDLEKLRARVDHADQHLKEVGLHLHAEQMTREQRESLVQKSLADVEKRLEQTSTKQHLLEARLAGIVDDNKNHNGKVAQDLQRMEVTLRAKTPHLSDAEGRVAVIEKQGATHGALSLQQRLGDIEKRLSDSNKMYQELDTTTAMVFDKHRNCIENLQTAMMQKVGVEDFECQRAADAQEMQRLEAMLRAKLQAITLLMQSAGAPRGNSP